MASITQASVRDVCVMACLSVWFCLGFEWFCHSARDGFGMVLVMFRDDVSKFGDGCVMAFLSALVLEWRCYSARGGFCLALVRSCCDL